MVANRKPPERRQDNSSSRQLATVTSIVGKRPSAPPPEPSPLWLVEVQVEWREFWESEVAQAVATVHHPVLRRLFDMRDAHARSMNVYRARPFVQGSQKQPVINPAMRVARELESDMRQLEDRLGLSPKAQANLGIAIGHQALTAAELNRLALEGVGDDGDDQRGEGDSSQAGVPDDILQAEWGEA